MHRIFLGLAAAAAMTFGAANNADAADFFFGINSGYGSPYARSAYGVSRVPYGYGSPYSVGRAYVPSRALYPSSLYRAPGGSYRYASPRSPYVRSPYLSPYSSRFVSPRSCSPYGFRY